MTVSYEWCSLLFMSWTKACAKAWACLCAIVAALCDYWKEHNITFACLLSLHMVLKFVYWSVEVDRLNYHFQLGTKWAVSCDHVKISRERSLLHTSVTACSLQQTNIWIGLHSGSVYINVACVSFLCQRKAASGLHGLCFGNCWRN